MNHNGSVTLMVLLLSIVACGPEQQLQTPPAQQSPAPGGDTAEAASEEVYITPVRGTVPQLVPGSLKLGVTEADLEELEEQSLAAQRAEGEAGSVHALGLVLSGQFGFAGGLFGSNFDVVVGSPLPSGMIRDYPSVYSFNGNGGCYFSRWYSHDPNDGRMIVTAYAPAFGGANCVWQVYAH